MPVPARPRLGLHARVLAFVATLVVGLAAMAGVASAHTNLKGADPPDGSVFVTAPPSITLHFSEKLKLDLVEANLTNASNQSIDLPPLATGAKGTDLLVTLPALQPDAYRLNYKVRDPVDLHLTTGSIVFGVGENVAIVGSEKEPPVKPLESMLRWLARSGLALAIGAFSIGAWHARRVADKATRRRMVDAALNLVVPGLVLVLVGELGSVIAELVDIGGPYSRTIRQVVWSSAYGRRFLVTAQLVIGLLVFLRLARKPLQRSLARGRLGIFEVGPAVVLAGLAVTAALSAHAGTGGAFLVGMGLRVVHLVALGLWAGGLVALLVIARRGDPFDRAELLASFSPVAAGAVLATVVSGLLLSAREVQSMTALLSTRFGFTLVVKLGVLAAALALGAWHARCVRHDRAPSTRTMTIEAALAVVVIAGGAVLASGQPAVGTRFSPPDVASPSTRTANADDLVVRVALRPNRPGRNTLRIEVLDTRRPPLGEVQRVTVRLTPTVGDAIQRVGEPHAGVADLEPVDLTAPGPLGIEVDIDRPAAPLDPVTFPWTIDRISVPRAKTVVSSEPLAPYANAAALVLLAVALGAVGASRLRGSRRLAEGN